MKCPKCGKYIAMTVAPYQRIYKDKDGHWKPRKDICQCDPDDICLWGLIKEREMKDKLRKGLK